MHNEAYFLNQIKSILQDLKKYGLVHCDLESVNLLITKKDYRIMLIDFDTCCSSDGVFRCSLFPVNTIKQIDGDQIIYDDAFTMVTHIRKIKGNFDENSSSLLSEIESFIGQNIHVEQKK